MRKRGREGEALCEMLMVHGVETIRGGVGAAEQYSCCRTRSPGCTGSGEQMLYRRPQHDRKRCDEVEADGSAQPETYIILPAQCDACSSTHPAFLNQTTPASIPMPYLDAVPGRRTK